MRATAGPSATFRSFAPLLIALAAIGVIAIAGITQRSLFGTPFADRFYGFFLDRYPLFVFAVVYGAARIIAAAFEPGWRWPRLATAPLGATAFLTICFYPTFGGFVLRPGFFVGSIGFLNGIPMPGAFVLGAAASALIYGFALGGGVVLARLAKPVFSLRALRSGLFRFGAVWFGAVIIAGPRAIGIDAAGGWPARPLLFDVALLSVAIVVAALLPHVILVSRTTSASCDARNVRKTSEASSGAPYRS